MRLFRGLGLAAAGAIAAVTMMAAPAGAATKFRVQLAHSKSPAAARTPAAGAVSGASRVSFEVDLRLRDAAGAQRFATSVATPGSADYHRYLTPAQWEARFSPSATAVREVVAYLRSSGFSVGSITADRMSIAVSGSASLVERVFGTSLSYHKVDGHRLRLADRNLSVPSGLAHVISGIVGVSQTLAHPDDTTGAAGSSSSSPSDQPAGFRVAPPCGHYFGQKVDTTLPQYAGYPADPSWAVCGYTGPQFRAAYGLTGPDNGAGVTVAIVDAYASPTLYQDAHQFAAINDPSNPLEPTQFSELLASKFSQAQVCDPPGWYGEQTLDVEAVHNTAPGAKILFAGAESCYTQPLNAMLHRIVDGHLANVITNSYGDLAGDLLDSFEDRQSTDEILLMAAGTGVSVMFSSGDSGDDFTSVGLSVPDYPASSPWATAVGGTTLEIGERGVRQAEYGWSTARSFLCNDTFITLGGCTESQRGTWLPIDLSLDGGSGGGTSYVYPQPDYQAGVVPTSLSEANSQYVGPQPMRVEPDISMEADPATGMLVGETQTFPDGTYYDQYRIGGTSVASPLLAGVVARAIEAAGHPLGFLNPLLYRLYRNSHDNVFYDIGPVTQDMSRSDYANSIDPSNGFLFSTRIVDYEGQEQFCNPITNECSTQNVSLNTAPGYDNMTGLGSPGSGFVAGLSGH
jgi:subtilase family serine protease